MYNPLMPKGGRGFRPGLVNMPGALPTQASGNASPAPLQPGWAPPGGLPDSQGGGWASRVPTGNSWTPGDGQPSWANLGQSQEVGQSVAAGGADAMHGGGWAAHEGVGSWTPGDGRPPWANGGGNVTQAAPPALPAQASATLPPQAGGNPVAMPNQARRQQLARSVLAGNPRF